MNTYRTYAVVAGVLPAVLTAANALTLVQEMVMAVWFIAKGFDLPASAARHGRTEANELLSAA